MSVQFVQKDQGGTIYYEAPERWDASPAPTVTLYGPSGAGEMVASQTATLGPSTTLDGDAAAGQTTVPLTATTSIVVGRQYTIGPNALGQSERVTVAGINASVSVVTRDDLQYTYATTHKFQSTRMSVTLASTDATASYRNCIARWTYKLATQARVDSTIFHVTNWYPTLSVTEQDVLRRDARAVSLIADRERLGDIIEMVWEEDVLPDIGAACPPGAIVSGSSLDKATVSKTLEHIFLSAQDYQAADVHAGIYASVLDLVKATAPIDVDQSGTITDDDHVRPSWTGRVFRV